MKYTEKIYDAITKEENIVEREYTAEELVELRAKEQEAKQLENIIAEKNVARKAVLDRLGITEEEARLLLG